MILPVFGCMNAFFEPDGDAMPGTKNVSFNSSPPFHRLHVHHHQCRHHARQGKTGHSGED
jgi:hypothetical protein